MTVAVNDGMLKADGLDDAIIGVGRRCGQPDLLVYDTDLVVKLLMDREGWSQEDAVEWMEFNIVGGWHGEYTPIWLYRGAPVEDVES